MKKLFRKILVVVMALAICLSPVTASAVPAEDNTAGSPIESSSYDVTSDISSVISKILSVFDFNKDGKLTSADFMYIVEKILSIFNGKDPEEPTEPENPEDPVDPEVKVDENDIGKYVWENRQNSMDADYAWISVLFCEDPDDPHYEEHTEAIKAKFKEIYLYEPTYDVELEYITTQYVSGYEGKQNIYRYSISDYTYPLITDEFYTIYVKNPREGKVWVGFCMPGSLYDGIEYTDQVVELLNERDELFCELTGKSMEYMSNHPDEYLLRGIGEAGMARTLDGQFLKVVYMFNMQK